MALNAASHNPPGIKTGPASGQPPPVSSETTAAILGASQEDLTHQHEAGKDGGDKQAITKGKSAKELEKERKKAEKQKKFEEKKAKTTATPTAAVASKSKEKRVKQEGAKEGQFPEYREMTPVGQKKSRHTAVRRGILLDSDLTIRSTLSLRRPLS